MTLSRREFLCKTASVSGAGVLSASAPFMTQLGSATAAETAAFPKPELLDDARKVPAKLRLDPRIWNWCRDMDKSAPMPANYYEASLAVWPEHEKLASDQSCDVVIVGAGLLGASAALHLVEAGLNVIVVEKDNVGSGASGRNGGQIKPGLARWEADAIAAHFSHDEAKRLWRFTSVEAVNLIGELSSRYDFACDYQQGHITAAIHSGHIGALVENADARRQLGDTAVRVVGAHELREFVSSDVYYGAAIDRLGGQVHPLALLRGLVSAYVRHGGRIYEGTPVEEIRKSASGTEVVTPYGTIRARQAVVLAIHSYTAQLLPDDATTIPLFTYVAVTPPLPVDMAMLLPGGLPVYDTQLQIDYYRPVRNNRLLFGGQGTGNSWSPRDVNNYLLHRIRTVFPQLPDPQLDYSWGGITDITLNGATDCRKTEDKVPLYAVHGWNGHGVAQSVRIGKAISDNITRRNDDFAMLTRFEHAQIPLSGYIGPFAIPVVKGALGFKNMLTPAEMISF